MVTRIVFGIASMLVFAVPAALAATAPVGATAGSFSVNQNGGPTYTIPIAVPPGTAGMEPKVALSYDKQIQSDLLGAGWAVGGLSIVHRCGTTKVLDGIKGGVNYDANDRFCLDGQRLIAVNGVYGANGSEYRTERESFSKIISYRDPSFTGSGPQYFRVTIKSGMVMEYGVTSDARIEAQGKPTVRLWALNKMQDINGNYLTVTYFKDTGATGTGEYHPTRIDYTGNSGAALAPYNSICFIYDNDPTTTPACDAVPTTTRPDIVPHYEGGSVVKTMRRLSHVQTYVDAALVRSYRLTYDNYGTVGGSRLLSVTECGNDGVCLPGTTFTWVLAPVGFANAEITWPQCEYVDSVPPHWWCPPGGDVTTSTYGLWNRDVTNIIPGDFDGDGKTDLIKQDDSHYQGKATLYRSNGNGTFTSVATIPGNWDRNHVNIIPGDFNGDGRLDFIRQTDSTMQGLAIMYFSNGDGTFNTVDMGSPGTWDRDHVNIIPGDFNGDGRTDFLQQTDGTTATLTVYLSNGDGTFTATALPSPPDCEYLDTVPPRWYCPPGGSRTATTYGFWNRTYTKLITGDFDGDGKTDFIRQDSATFGGIATLYRSNGDGTFTAVAMGGSPGSWDFAHVNIIPDDFNGDGKLDLIKQTDSTLQSLATVYLSKGDGTFTAVDLDSPGSWDKNHVIIISGDFNADGKMDFIKQTDSSTQGLGTVYLSKGDGTFTQVGMGSPGTWSWDYTSLIPGDFNGDGKTDFIKQNGTSWQYQGSAILYSNTPAGVSDVLASITNGLGAQTTITPKPLTDSSVYTKDPSVSCLQPNPPPTNLAAANVNCYPYQNVQAAIYVVSRVTQSDGIGGVRGTSYRYFGAKAHLAGPGWLGFRRVETTDEPGGIPSGMMSGAEYDQRYEVGLNGMPTLQETKLGARPLKQVQSFWEGVATTDPALAGNTAAGKVRFAKLNGTLEQNFEPNLPAGSDLVSCVSADNTFGSYGETTQTIAKTDASCSFASAWMKTVANIYEHDTANWILGKLTRSQVTTSVPGVLSRTRTSGFAYDALGRLTSEVIEPDQPSNSTLRLAMTHEYADPYGNGTATTVSGANPDSTLFSRTTRHVYDARGQFPTKTINALQQESTASYDPKWGTLLSQADPNHVAVSWGYDGFGRRISETRPGVSVTLPDGTTTSITYAACGGSNPCPSFDNGAVASYTVTTQSSGAAPSTTYFDLLGRALREQTVGLSGATILSDTQYDNQGRVAQSSLPYFAAGTVRWNTPTYDALGRVRILTEADGGVTTTTYLGPTTTVEQSGPDITTRSRTAVTNAAGQLVSLTDSLYPSQSTTYQYDALGKLSQVTDALRNQTTIVNDLHGRKTSIDDPDMGVWTYSYDSLGELFSQTDNNNQTKDVRYDPLGRLKTRTTLEGISTWTYDTATNGIGKFASVTRPDGYQESATYDSLGRPSTHTVTIGIGGPSYTTTTTYDTLGRIDTTTYPSTGFAVKRNYSNGYLTEIRNVQTNLRYWLANDNDALGHIVSETLGNNLTTISTYDPASGALQSLLTSGAPGIAQNEGFTFDVLGNLRARTDYIQNVAETYTYDTLNRLKVVTGPSPKNFEYDVIGNISSKSDVGTYAYNNTYIVNGSNRVRPHAVSATSGTLNASYSYDNNGNLLSGAGRTVTWTSFNKPAQIIQGAGTTTLTYGAHLNRVKKVSPTSTTIYVGGFYERVTTGSLVEDKHYVGAGRTLVVYTQRSTGANDTRYLHTDHLGSVVTTTNENGDVVQRLAYDAYGKRRNVDWTDPTTPITAQTTFGFTGHEMDDEVGLINMRAREYDPTLGRFMSSDTTIDGISGQGLNRYSYVANNPLSYTDPTGRSWKRKLMYKLMRYGLTPELAYLEAYVLKPRQDAFLLNHPQWQPVVKVVTDLIICIYGRDPLICAGGSALFNAEFDRHMCERSGGTTDQCNDVTVTSFGSTFITALVAGGVADQPWYVQVPANAAAAGFAAEAQGGDFRDGVLQSLKFAALFYTYSALTGDTPMAHQRSRVNDVGFILPEGSRAILDALTFDGREVSALDLETAGLSGCVEGSGCSRVLSKVPLIKAVSSLHDWMMGSSSVGFPSQDVPGMGTVIFRSPSNGFMNSLGNAFLIGPFVNYMLMAPAAAWTIGAMAYQIGVVPQRRYWPE